MNLAEQYRHLKLKKWLPQVVDEQLPAELSARVKTHLSRCRSCRQSLEDIQFCRKIIGAEQLQTDRPKAFFVQSANNVMESHPSISTPVVSAARIFMIAAAAITVLMVARHTGVLPRDAGSKPISAEYPDGQQAGIDFGYLFALMDKQDSTDPFYARFNSRLVKNSEVDSCSLVPLVPENIRASKLAIDCVRFLRSASIDCAELSCTADGKAFKLFQQVAGQPWRLGNNPLTKENIAGIECLVIDKKQYCAVVWKEGGREFLLVGKMSRNEIAEIIRSI